MAAVTPPHVVVVGAGVSGLAAAWRLASAGDVRVTVLESSPRVGGALRSGELAGVPVDLGAESVLARRPEALDLLAAAGLGDDVVRPLTLRASVASRGALRPLPRGTVLGIPTDLPSLAQSRILSARGVARVALDLALPRTALRSDVSVGAYVTRRLGREAVDRLVEPLLAGVYAGHADRLSFAATMAEVVPEARQHRSLIEAARAVVAQPDRPAEAMLAGVVGGVGRLPERLLAGLHSQGVAVRCATPVRAMSRVDGGWQLAVGSRPRARQVTADAVVLAVPAAAATRLLAPSSPRARRELDAVEAASIAVVSLAYPSSALVSRPVGSGFLVPAVEGGSVKAVTWSSSKWTWVRAAAPGLLIVRASIGRHGEQRVLQRDDTELAQLAAADLARHAGVGGSPLDVLVTRWGGALPQYQVGHLDRVARTRQALARDAPGVEVCGATYDGVGVAACVASGNDAADRVLRRYRADATMAR